MNSLPELIGQGSFAKKLSAIIIGSGASAFTAQQLLLQTPLILLASITLLIGCSVSHKRILNRSTYASWNWCNFSCKATLVVLSPII